MNRMNQWITVLFFIALLGGCSSDENDGMLKISSSPADAEIYIDGDRKGNTPAKKGQTFAIKLSEGEHKVEIIKSIQNPGKYDQYYGEKTVFVAEKSLQTVSLSLDKRQTPSHKEKWEEEQRLKTIAKAEEDRRKAMAKAEEDRRRAKVKAEEDRQRAKVKAEEDRQRAKTIAKMLKSISANMVTIPSGSFKMGSNEGSDEKPIHTVHISSFKMGKYEVTQGQWLAVTGDTPSRFSGMNKPVEQVSWDDIQLFLGKLNKMTGKKFRLPSEAEWEYAARAGTSSKWSWGNSEGSAGSYAWYAGSKTHPVGQKKPNAFGLYDMHGNVWEWVEDWYSDSYYRQSATTDPTGPSSGQDRVVRGGSWDDGAGDLRSAYRFNLWPGYRYYFIGFRLVRQP